MLRAMATGISASTDVDMSRDRRAAMEQHHHQRQEQAEVEVLPRFDARCSGRLQCVRTRSEPGQAVHRSSLGCCALRLPCRSVRGAAFPTSRATRSMKRSKNAATSASTATSRLGRLAPPAPPVRDGLARRPCTTQLDFDGDRLGAYEGPIERRRDGQGVVDEGAVEAVVAAVELHVEAQRVVDEAQDRVVVGSPAPCAGARPGGRASSSRAR